MEKQAARGLSAVHGHRKGNLGTHVEQFACAILFRIVMKCGHETTSGLSLIMWMILQRIDDTVMFLVHMRVLFETAAWMVRRKL